MVDPGGSHGYRRYICPVYSQITHPVYHIKNKEKLLKSKLIKLYFAKFDLSHDLKKCILGNTCKFSGL
jgi:hypothetical protein